MKRVLLCLMVLLGLNTHAVALAQPSISDTAFESQLTGQVIDLGTSDLFTFAPQEYLLEEDDPYAAEYVSINSFWSTYILGFVQGPITFEIMRAITIEPLQEDFDSFEVLAEEQVERHAWFLATLESEGYVLYVLYIHQIDAYGDTDFVFLHYGMEPTLVNDFSQVKKEVLVDGQPILSEFDADWLTETLANEPNGIDDPADLLDTISSMEEGRETYPLSELLDPGQGTETGQQDPESLEEWGLVSESEWVSPMYGTSVAWDPVTWEFPFDYPYAYYSVDNPPYDGFSLVTHDEAVWLDFTVHDTGGYLTPGDYLDHWRSPGYAAEFEQGFAVVASDVSDTTVAIVAETTDIYGEPVLVVTTATFLPDGKVLQSQLFAHPENMPAAYDQFHDSIIVNGLPLDLTWTVPELQGILGTLKQNDHGVSSHGRLVS